MAAAPKESNETDNFKAVFKKYKRRDQKLDLSEVIDVCQHKESLCQSQTVTRVTPAVPTIADIVGLQPVQHWDIFHFLQHPGFYLISNPFTAGSQRYWVSRCLRDLPQPPNVTNLRVHPDLDPSTLWASFQFGISAGIPLDSSHPVRKLRWTTIGYHYDWDTKQYREDAHSPFPSDFGVLAQYVGQVLGFDDLQPEAGIINYYHLDSTLGAHTDHSELDHCAPLVSISFGQDAIFLIGGQTKVTPPTAVLLHSGDICVMSGESRLAYHAVPRILRPTSPHPLPCFGLSPGDLHWLTYQATQGEMLTEQSERNGNVLTEQSERNGNVLTEQSERNGNVLTEQSERNGNVLTDQSEGNGNVLTDQLQWNRKTLTDKLDGEGEILRDKLQGDREALTEKPEGDGEMLTEKLEEDGEVLTDKLQGEGEPLRDTLQGEGETLRDKLERDEQTLADKLEEDEQTLADKLEEDVQTLKEKSYSSSDTSINRPDDRKDTVTDEGEGSGDTCTREPGGGVCAVEPDSKRPRHSSGCAGGHIPHTAHRTQAEPQQHVASGAVTPTIQTVRKVNTSIVETLRGQDWQPFAVYLAASRLNVNIRQVLPPGHTFLSASHR